MPIAVADPAAPAASGGARSKPHQTAGDRTARDDVLAAFDTPPLIFRPSVAARVPLLLVLHGLGDGGAVLAERYRLAGLAELKRIAMVVPTGDLNRSGQRFWNAGPACCDFDGQAPDDAGRLRRLIEYALHELRVDPSRVFVIGFFERRIHGAPARLRLGRLDRRRGQHRGRGI